MSNCAAGANILKGFSASVCVLWILTFGATLVAVPGRVGARSVGASVTIRRLTDGEIQPQCAVDSKCIVHVVFFMGPPESGDLYYYRFSVTAGPDSASKPIKVNSETSTATAMGTIRSEQIVIGQGDRVHVIWNGLAPKEGKKYAPMYAAYARLNDTGTGFEPQRNLCQWTGNLDGGDSIAADLGGNVYATWHTGPPNNTRGEAARGVYIAVSHDNGRTFDRERLANLDPTGACACCSMKAQVDRSGTLRVLYRAARNGGTERDTMLLTSSDQGKNFRLNSVDPWALNSCPMSSFSLAENSGEPLAAWETKEKVFWSPLGSDGRPVAAPIAAPRGEKSKHPIIVSNGKGSVLFAWTEGTGWQRGGSLSWQVYKLVEGPSAVAQPVGPIGHADGLPVWGLLSGYAKPDGSFVILY